jgi:hypothetical protein
MNTRDARLGLAGRMVLRLTEATRQELGMDDDPEVGRLTAALMAPALAARGGATRERLT